MQWYNKDLLQFIFMGQRSYVYVIRLLNMLSRLAEIVDVHQPKSVNS